MLNPVVHQTDIICLGDYCNILTQLSQAQASFASKSRQSLHDQLIQLLQGDMNMWNSIIDLLNLKDKWEKPAVMLSKIANKSLLKEVAVDEGF